MDLRHESGDGHSQGEVLPTPPRVRPGPTPHCSLYRAVQGDVAAHVEIV